MATVRVPTYLVAPASAMVAGPWLVRDGSDWVRLEEELKGFDPGGSIDLKRTVRFDQHRVRTACDLSADDVIGLVPLWSSRLTARKGAGEAFQLRTSEPDGETDLALTLQGGDLGGSLLLRTVLVLVRSAGEGRPLVAHVPGSILWEDLPHRVDLEGAGTRFPMEMRTFGQGNGFPPRAAWYLDWDRGDLSLPVLGSVRLYLNQAHPRMAAVASGQSDPELDGVREALGFDVVRQLIAGALADREFLADPDGFPAGSVGATVRLLCRGVLFPYSSVEELAHLALSRPSRFEADLQAAVSLYWDPGG